MILLDLRMEVWIDYVLLLQAGVPKLSLVFIKNDGLKLVLSSTTL